MEQLSVFPQRSRILSGSALKTLALIAMLIDHTAICFSPWLGTSLYASMPAALVPLLTKLFQFLKVPFTPYVLLRGIGRIAFPIFCFLLAEGARHTRSWKRYAGSLLLFALVSEIPFNLFNSGSLQFARQNVFFTLFLGYLGILALERVREHPFLASLTLAMLGVVSCFLQADYGWAGYLFILLLYLLARQPAVQLFSGVALLGWPVGVALAFPLMNLYNGKRGFIRGPVWKYLYYGIYPVHLTLLWLLHRHFFGY